MFVYPNYCYLMDTVPIQAFTPAAQFLEIIGRCTLPEMNGVTLKDYLADALRKMKGANKTLTRKKMGIDLKAEYITRDNIGNPQSFFTDEEGNVIKLVAIYNKPNIYHNLPNAWNVGNDLTKSARYRTDCGRYVIRVSPPNNGKIRVEMENF